MFTMDLWYDFTNFLHLAFVGSDNSGYIFTVVVFSCFVPLDMLNLFIRTGYCLEDIPARSHLYNLVFEVPMLSFNIFVLITCAPPVCIAPGAAIAELHLAAGTSLSHARWCGVKMLSTGPSQ